MLLVLTFACVAAAAFLVGEVATLPARQRVGSIRRAANYGRVRLPSDVGPRFHERVVTPFLLRIAGLVLRLNPKTTVESVSAKLLAAGLAQRVSPSTFLAVKGIAAVLGIALGVVVGTAGGAIGYLLAFVLGAL